MSRKEVIGECRICKQLKKLTYEHVPPRVTFNDKRIDSIEGEKIAGYLKRKNSYPWEMDGIRKTIHQQGRGGMYPLAIIKQVIAMFCDINSEGFVEEGITSFLLDKESQIFDSKRYRIFMHIHAGSIERMNGFSASINVSLLEGKNGLFVAMPSYKTKQTDKDGKSVYQDYSDFLIIPIFLISILQPTVIKQFSFATTHI